MEIDILSINRSLLSEMQDILSLSAGYQISMDDELQYFDPQNSDGWLLVKNSQNHNIAFIRYFKQRLNWSLAELYVDSTLKDRGALAHQLIDEFKKQTQFSSEHRLRFDILKSDSELNDVIKASGLSQKVQFFRHFEMSVVSSDKQDIESSGELNVSEVTETLLHLNPVTESEVLEWINKGQIRTIVENSRVVAAAQLFFSDDSIEINRIATHPQSLRQGFAERLIHLIRTEAAHKGKSRIYLKVEDIRNPAIALYKKTGFLEVESKGQLWHSSWGRP